MVPLLVALAAIASASVAQRVVEPEIQVNQNDISGDQRAPAVAATGSGTWRVVWTDGLAGTYSRFFDRDGAPDNGDLAPYAPGDQPSIAVDAAGNFVTATHVCTNPAVGVGDKILVGGVTVAQDPSASLCGTVLGHPVVARSASGNYAAAWEDRVAGTVRAQLFAADGSVLRSSFLVGTGNWPAIAMDAVGDFVVVWQTTTLTALSDIAGQRYDSNGVEVGGTFQVNSSATGDQFSPAVAMDAAGDFLVAWHSNYPSTGYWSIQSHFFDSAGQPVRADDDAVSTYTPASQYYPAVAADAQGNFLVAWESYGSAGTDGSYSSIQARRMDRTGVLSFTRQFQVNAYTTGYQLHASVAAADAGAFVVAWESTSSAGSDTSGYSVHARRFGFTNLLVDGDMAETGPWLTPGFVDSSSARIDLGTSDWGPNGAPSCIELGYSLYDGSSLAALQGVPVVAGDRYVVRAWNRIPSAAPGTSADIRVDWMTAGGLAYGQGLPSFDVGGGWDQLALTVAAPAGAYAAYVYLHLATPSSGGGESVARFDEVLFARQLLFRHGFEPGDPLPWSARSPP